MGWERAKHQTNVVTYPRSRFIQICRTRDALVIEAVLNCQRVRVSLRQDARTIRE